ncbi:hypothetical protein [Burkholderia sp. AU45388]|uniref:hypothetical protein n=1 Tax=Burkholderia sp. AU45388 TaxID=3059206 RepID=UPI002653A204|nr:hypothetical protein [Burkholderia sp. AU45388]MDN7430541.1 hypothetical protein [Burkholderia sp. AU45388]
MESEFDKVEKKVRDKIKNEQEVAAEEYRLLVARRDRLKTFERIASVVTPIFFAIISLFIFIASYKRGYFDVFGVITSSSTFSWILSGIAVTVTAGALLYYLRDGASTANFRRLSDKVEEVEILLNSQPAFVKKEIGRFFISEELRQDIITEIKDEIRSSTLDSALTALAEENQEAKKKIQFLERVSSEHFDTTVRLDDAISNLQTRANLNLVFGIILTGIGVTILWQTLSLSIHGDSMWDFARTYFPRLSLVLIVELFSYFFLNLYKSNLSETRYYHNELTNISNRRISLMCALESGEQEMLTPVITELSKTERNNILKKGQTTVEIEKERIQSDANKNLTSIVERLLQAAIPSKKE